MEDEMPTPRENAGRMRHFDRGRRSETDLGAKLAQAQQESRFAHEQIAKVKRTLVETKEENERTLAGMKKILDEERALRHGAEARAATAEQARAVLEHQKLELVEGMRLATTTMKEQADRNEQLASERDSLARKLEGLGRRQEKQLEIEGLRSELAKAKAQIPEPKTGIFYERKPEAPCPG
jgi:chromosome segregation ATPase